MPAISLRLSRLALGLVACAAAAGCGSFDSATHRFASSITPYKPAVVQGNFVSREQVQALRPGMSRQQVRDLLGTPLVTSLFHDDRWDYVFTLRRQGVAPQSHHLAVWFKGDALDHFSGAESLPKEAEFLDQIDTGRHEAKVPPLEATEAQLSRYAAPKVPTASPEPPPLDAHYPPLEPPVQ